jgi:hypothetical protein
MKHAAPQFFTGASAPKKKVFVGPVQSRRIRRTLGEIGRVAAPSMGRILAGKA